MNNSEFKRVGLLKRLIISFYDLLLLFSILFFMSIPIVYINGDAIINNLFFKIYIFIISYLYYSWFWVNHNQTLGMKAWKTYIINNNGKHQITYTQSFVRIVTALLGGHIYLLFSNKTLQDKFSFTNLVKK